jgi:hypothetical protein
MRQVTFALSVPSKFAKATTQTIVIAIITEQANARERGNR